MSTIEDNAKQNQENVDRYEAEQKARAIAGETTPAPERAAREAAARVSKHQAYLAKNWETYGDDGEEQYVLELHKDINTVLALLSRQTAEADALQDKLNHAALALEKLATLDADSVPEGHRAALKYLAEQIRDPRGLKNNAEALRKELADAREDTECLNWLNNFLTIDNMTDLFGREGVAADGGPVDLRSYIKTKL